MKVYAISFTRQGAALCAKLCGLLAEEYPVEGFGPSYGETECGIRSFEGSVSRWVGERLREDAAIVFIGALDIALRALSSYEKEAKGKWLVRVDEDARFVVPLLEPDRQCEAFVRNVAALLKAAPVQISAAEDR